MAECTQEERELLDRLTKQTALDSALEGVRNEKLAEQRDGRGKPLPTLFLSCPTNDNRTHRRWTISAIKTHAAFPGRVATIVENGTLLPRNRDLITDRFLDSGATHMLCVDGDIAWHPAQIQALLDTGKPFVSGTYCIKSGSHEIPAKYTGRCEGWPFETLFSDGTRGELLEHPLWECDDVPAGFLLLTRETVERMVGGYRAVQYRSKNYGIIPGLWHPTALAQGEDIAFCKRWRELGGEIWMHRGVALDHIGEHTWRPDPRDVTPELADRMPDGKRKPELTRPSVIVEKDLTPGPTMPEATKPNGIITKVEGTLPVHIHPDAAS